MTILEKLSKIQKIHSTDNGGDNALDGFEFQISSAIYLVFENYRDKKDFALMYEKVEDFIIINESINLYQAKSITNTITPNVLYSVAKKTPSSEGRSIFDKMYSNYLEILGIFLTEDVSNTLIVSDSQLFSKKLFIDGSLCDSLSINFSDLSDSAKKEIESNSQHGLVNWNAIKARRLIPKESHEAVTRVFIEDVITKSFGANKISSSALYNSLCVEIRKIRKSKNQLSSEMLHSEIIKYTHFEFDLKFKDYIHLLNTDDSSNISIIIQFNCLKISILLDNSPDNTFYKQIKSWLQDKKFDSYYEYLNHIQLKTNDKEHSFNNDENYLKALLIVFFAKEIL